MPRQRRTMEKLNRPPPKKPPKLRNEAKEKRTWPNEYIVRAVLMISCIVIAAAICFKGYLETRVNARFDSNKMVEKSGLQVPELYWGSYRPGVYFGMKTRDPQSLSFGLMWFFPRLIGKSDSALRHWCEQSDNLKQYIWTDHDGRHFGVQEIVDGPYHIETDFVKRPGGHHGGDWTARIKVHSDDERLVNAEVGLIFYVAADKKTEATITTYREDDDGDAMTGIRGFSKGLGHFRLKALTKGDVLANSYLSTKVPGLNLLTNAVKEEMRVTQDKATKKKIFILPGEVLQTLDSVKEEPNFVALQFHAKMPFTVTLVYESESFTNRTDTLADEIFEQELFRRREEFRDKFNSIFQLHEKNWSTEECLIARAALSNMLGSIGYFYGASQVASAQSEGTVPYWKASLFTAVPSRSFFPRGFLWDDAFHGLLISTWDVAIELDIIHHWFDLMNIEGWIPREQILGEEALSKVPQEFVTQINTNANPPIFFLTLQYIIRNYGEQLRKEQKLGEIDRLYPRLQAWFEWFNSTQVGNEPGSYRWRGRDSETDRELNPKTLTSGLDDYPRASHPTIDERHVDLRCWMTMAAQTMTEIAQLLGRDGSKYAETYAYLSDVKLLNEFHWSKQNQQYADWGLHTDDVVLQRKPNKKQKRSSVQEKEPLVRVSFKEPTARFVDTSFGYVSLFPFLLEILPADSPQLGTLLKKLDRPDLLWTPFGLRSLATTSPFYQKYNTEHDPPYWRGAIWINMNFLAVRALKHYSDLEGPYAQLAQELYQKLRSNVINNVIHEFKRTGYFWEQYHDKTGHGQGCRPFTGWTALFVMMMSEKY